jgi:hypothetical protein
MRVYARACASNQSIHRSRSHPPTGSQVVREFPDIRIAYGVSDEYSFVLHHTTAMYGESTWACGWMLSAHMLRSQPTQPTPNHPNRTGRRTSKVVSVITSCFTANYVRWWGELMGPETPLAATPAFDGRAVCYPNAAVLRDYLSWRQADCHINNQVGGRGGVARARSSWLAGRHAYASTPQRTHTRAHAPRPTFCRSLLPPDSTTRRSGSWSRAACPPRRPRPRWPGRTPALKTSCSFRNSASTTTSCRRSSAR